jgi:lipoprotein-anchoring transpeptidase ErfK/SrfK
MALTLALVLTGLPGLTADDGSQTPLPGVSVAYAATTGGAVTGGAITGGAVTAPAVLSLAQIAPIDDLTYTGKKKKPSPKVTLNGKKLKKNRDYTVSYKNNKLPGKATLTIKGKAPNYTGTKEITFKIIIQKPTNFKLKASADAVTASWKKAPGTITGYKIYYAANASFTNSKKVRYIVSSKTTSYSIDRPYYKNAYYVKVRAYKTIGKKNYYSVFTKVKVKKTASASWYKKFSSNVGTDTKWIEADLSKQIVYLHKGEKNILKRYGVSSGKPGTPTVRGTFRIYKKIKLHDMKGDWNPKTNAWGYVTPNVPWSSYFKEGYAFHGAYWNPQVNIPVDQKRVPRSHGCVNMRVKDAKYLYNWAPTGTLVIVHK